MRFRTLNRCVQRDRIGTILNAFLADQITCLNQLTRNAEVEVVAKFFADHLTIFISCAAFAYSAFTLTGTGTELVIAQCLALILRLTVAVGSRPTIVTVALTALAHSVSGANFPSVPRARIIVAFAEFTANFLKKRKVTFSTRIVIFFCNFKIKKKITSSGFGRSLHSHCPQTHCPRLPQVILLGPRHSAIRVVWSCPEEQLQV